MRRKFNKLAFEKTKARFDIFTQSLKPRAVPILPLPGRSQVVITGNTALLLLDYRNYPGEIKKFTGLGQKKMVDFNNCSLDLLTENQYSKLFFTCN